MEIIAISKIKPNPDNPRLIKDDKYKKLVQSIKDFPEMLELRPVVINKDFMVLGGNMRLKACQEAGLSEIPILKAENLTKEQQKEFIIKDNQNFGEWDFELLANDFEMDKLIEWGFENWQIGIDEKNSQDEWVGLPEYLSEKFEGFTQIVVNFLTEEDYKNFQKQINQKLTEKTKVIWCPKQDFDQMGRNTAFVNES